MTLGAGARRAASALRLAWRSGPLILPSHVAINVVGAAVPVAVAWLTKLALDGIAAGASWTSLLALACGLAALGTVAAVLPQAESFLGTELTRRIGLLSMDRLYQAVDAFTGLGRFEDPDFYDRLRLARDSSRTAPSDLAQSVIGLARACLTTVGFVGSLLVLSPMMTAAVLLTAVPAVLAERRLAKLRATMMWDISPAIRRELFYSMLLAELRAAKEVRLFGFGTFLRHRMLTERRAANAAERRMDLRELYTQGALALLLSLVAGAGLVWAVHAARTGRLSVGDVSMFVVAVASAQSAVAQIVAEYALARQSLLMFEHYVAVLEAGPDLPVATEPAAAPPLRHGVEFRDVWFRYSRDHPWVLRGVNLTIPYGRAVALVGANGAGKTTLVKLLCRFYDPTRGAILWDGVDLRNVDPAALRDRLGAVFQDFMEYDLTAAENIALGDVRALADLERLESSARMAGVHDTVAALPHGYHTLLSRMFQPEHGQEEQDPQVGVMLSTGQWQRLALARALLRVGKDLLIFDEPSSGLDARAEHQIHTMLREQRAGRTSLLISHRLGAIRDADQIVVIENGEVTETGDHNTLIKLDRTYAHLFSLQAEGYRGLSPAEKTIN